MLSNNNKYPTNLSEKESRRFWDKVEKTDYCWNWTASKNKGYGQFGLRNFIILSHRLSYVLTNGSVSEDIVIDHLCRNKTCVNPDHLEAVTVKENTIRGDLPKVAGQNERDKTHCPNNHPLTYPNLIPARVLKGVRQCLSCDRANAKYRNAKRKGIVLDPSLLQQVADEYYKALFH